ncbi:MAG TPA: type III pantothenate kinase [Limnobacter sp.]|nr:type III pantothenate kinase [Limnobacter sp.]
MNAPVTLLCVDAGNSMVKLMPCRSSQSVDWQVAERAIHRAPSSEWVRVEQALMHLRNAVPADLLGFGTPPVVLLCSVLGAEFEAVLRAACKALGWPLQVMQVRGNRLMHTLYEQPEQLGKDRWAACLAVAASTSFKSNLVVSFGTATTLDALVHHSLVAGPLASGCHTWLHLGGFIVPGVGTMLSSLANATAQLPKAGLAWAQWPQNTATAIGAGVARQQLSMVTHAMSLLQTSSTVESPALWCTGGYAEAMLPQLQAVVPTVNLFQHAVLRALLLEQQFHTGGTS